MKNNPVAALVGVVVLTFTLVASAQNKAQPERITNGPVVKQTTGSVAGIAWSTDAPGSSIVKYGTSPNALSDIAEAPWGGTKESNGDYNHTVWLKNLKPNTTYYFICRDDARCGNWYANAKPAEGVPYG